MYLLAICNSSFANSLFNSCVHFFIGMLILWGISSLHYWRLIILWWPLRSHCNIDRHGIQIKEKVLE
jgi:hypothetical protein